MSISPEAVLEILKTGAFENLVGQFETEFIEAKGQPYDLASDERKLELAKDVSGLANASGGLLLLGFATEASATHGEDVIVRPRPFPLRMFNRDQHIQVLDSWLWPALDVGIEVFPSADDPEKGVAVIRVPVVDPSNKPVLVSKTLFDTPRRVELVVGYCERKQARVTHYDVTRIHELVRDGLRFDREMRSGFEAILAALCRLQISPAAVLSPPGEVEARIDSAIQAVRLSKSANFVLVAVPSQPLNLRGLFESRHHELVRLLEEPPEVRNHGFDLNVGGNSTLAGDLRRVSVDGYRLLEVHRDGVVIFVAQGDRDGLCWGRQHQQDQRYLVNQLFLIEVTYLFCKFVCEMYAGQLADGQGLEIRLEIRNLRWGPESTFQLEPGPLGGFGPWSTTESPDETIKVREVVTCANAPEHLAVQVLAPLYAQFGYEADQIPYTTNDADGRAVDPAKIIKAGQR